MAMARNIILAEQSYFGNNVMKTASDFSILFFSFSITGKLVTHFPGFPGLVGTLPDYFWFKGVFAIRDHSF